MDLLRRHLRHHGSFYLTAAIGVAAFFFIPNMSAALRLVASGDLFFLSYMAAKAFDASGVSTTELRQRAKFEDEGVFLVVAIVIAIIAVSSIAIFNVLNGTNLTRLSLTLSLLGAPLGWLTLHTLAAFHYAHRYYAPAAKTAAEGLEFPGCETPGMWEFLYFSFVIGMTAQTSDVQITTTAMRRAALTHSVVSFFYNTLIIAMAVNAVVALASVR